MPTTRRPTPVISGPRRNPTGSAGRSASTCWSIIWLTNFTQPQNRQYEGRLITDIAEMRGQDPEDALFDLLLEENLGLSTVGLGTNAQTLCAFVSHSYRMIASDAILFGEYPNPRTTAASPSCWPNSCGRRSTCDCPRPSAR